MTDGMIKSLNTILYIPHKIIRAFGYFAELAGGNFDFDMNLFYINEFGSLVERKYHKSGLTNKEIEQLQKEKSLVLQIKRIFENNKKENPETVGYEWAHDVSDGYEYFDYFNMNLINSLGNVTIRFVSHEPKKNENFHITAQFCNIVSKEGENVKFDYEFSPDSVEIHKWPDRLMKEYFVWLRQYIDDAEGYYKRSVWLRECMVPESKLLFESEG